ncbi:MAG: ribosome biogenesis GTPase Der [Alphaproteobacteria bacterium]|nr:ribosome biogenesis GTPase Der [Alphaproteobacteria bacterium]|tara:strand:+ start:1670 stop:2992 length:1323 start_codon:yes stop_codon:yes gene_type:complete
MALPVVAIIGRPNVGKSTLFNRLAGRRIAIVSDIPGTTRDRVSIDAEWGRHRYLVVDTAGVEDRPHDELLWSDIRAQVEVALNQADAIIFMVDINDGVTDADEDSANLVRRSGKPVVLAVNKADNLSREDMIYEFYSLGLGDPHPISAYHDTGIGDLMQDVFQQMPLFEDEPVGQNSIRVAIAGRPNAGKSSLFNALTGEERAIVSPVAGTTRDTVDSLFEFEGTRFTFLDTAGLRRRGSVESGLEKYSAIRTIGAIERCYVAVLVLDSTEFVTAQDQHIGGYIDDASRAAVIVINKWDLAPELGLNKADAVEAVRNRFRFIPNVPVLFTSALTGWGVEKVLPIILDVYEEFSKQIPRSEISRAIFDAMGENPLPGIGSQRPRIYRSIQSRTSPPTFEFIARNPDLIHFSYRRYLENRLRERFGFIGSPLRMTFKTRDDD